MMGLSMWEMVLIFMVVLLLFGAKRLPEIGSSLGKGIREFKGSLREIEGELKLPPEAKAPPAAAPPAQATPAQATPAEPARKEEEGGGEPRRLTTS